MTDYLTIATWALVIIAFISAIIAVFKLSIIKRDRERKVIVEIVKIFLIPTLNTLELNRKNFNKININSFPDFLILDFSIPNYILKSTSFDSFTQRKYLLKRQILRYNKDCLKINEKINELKTTTRNKGITYSKFNKKGEREVLAEQYENEDKIKILDAEGLKKDISDIEDVIKKNQGLDDKTEKLIHKLEKIKRKLQRKYYLTEDELKDSW